MGKHRSILFVVLAALAAGGCVATLTPEQLTAERNAGWVMTVDTWEYCGSKDGFDYLINYRLGLITTYRYRIAQEHGVISQRFAYTTDESQWVRLPWGVDTSRSQPFKMEDRFLSEYFGDASLKKDDPIQRDYFGEASDYGRQ